MSVITSIIFSIMSTFVVYSYQFSPSFKNDMPSLFVEDTINHQEVWDNKQMYFDRVFKGAISYSYRGAYYASELLYDENGLIVFKLANNKHIVQESGFVPKKLEHKPSCLVLIDNRTNVQNIYIEKNEYSFSDTAVVANILAKTYNTCLQHLGLVIVIQKRFKASEFWSIVDSAEKGINMVRFSIQYPNLPEVRAKIDAMLSDTSKEFHSKETKIEFNAGDGEVLNLSKDSERIKDLVQASAETGNDITLKINGLRHYKKVGDTTETVEIDNLEGSLSSDLLTSGAQKLISILNHFKH